MFTSRGTRRILGSLIGLRCASPCSFLMSTRCRDDSDREYAICSDLTASIGRIAGATPTGSHQRMSRLGTLSTKLSMCSGSEKSEAQGPLLGKRGVSCAREQSNQEYQGKVSGI